MLNKFVVSAFSFLLLFAWQLTIICTNGLLYGQVSNNSFDSQVELQHELESHFGFAEMADDNSNASILVEEVLEEEIHPVESIRLQLVKHLSKKALFYYSLSPIYASRSFLVPPEHLASFDLQRSF